MIVVDGRIVESKDEYWSETDRVANFWSVDLFSQGCS